MEIRPAIREDIPAIVNLLRVSLGEDLLPKSESYWNWKHVDNPFGPSPVLICLDGGEVVGVRAFMRWNWWSGQHVYKAVRAVDTATHPGYQGQGIFKKLTLQLVDYCKSQGNDFVFNTPNGQSKPGYIKMGWTEAGKFPIQITARRPLSMVSSYLRNARTSDEKAIGGKQELNVILNHSDIANLISQHRAKTSEIITELSPNYLRWRYVEVPVASYVGIGVSEQDKLKALAIARIKRSRFGNELRVTELVAADSEHAARALRALRNRAKGWDIDYISISGRTQYSASSLGVLSVKGKMGPHVTTRTLALKDLSILREFSNWRPSLGDLELF
jgi:GNAT superfamily N-acetyltransferase